MDVSSFSASIRSFQILVPRYLIDSSRNENVTLLKLEQSAYSKKGEGHVLSKFLIFENYFHKSCHDFQNVFDITGESVQTWICMKTERIFSCIFEKDVSTNSC